MPPVNRNTPKSAHSSESQYSVMEFMREFPDDEACLNHLWRSRYSPDGEHAHCPRCDRERTFKRYKGARQRQVWKCTSCTQELSPTAGTIFHKSSTSLHLWFYAMWIMTSTRCGVSAKQLERELGVTYKTAWRMFNLIRNKLMNQDDDDPLSGRSRPTKRGSAGRCASPSSAGSGAWRPDRPARQGARNRARDVERGGEVRAIHVPSRYGYTLRSTIRRHVVPVSTVYTDDYSGYNGVNSRLHAPADQPLPPRLRRRRRAHADDRRVLLARQNGIRGVYHVVSAKWLQGYLNEYAWRYNHRDDPVAMFRRLLERAATTSCANGGSGRT